MTYVVCTLFEKHYIYGVSALINSLEKQGFRGEIYVGFRGNLQGWMENATTINSGFKWDGAKSIIVSDNIVIHLLPVNTHYHLAHYKPEFMIKILECLDDVNAGIVYFDPDIVVKCRWSFFELWIDSGVATVHEIVSNDMPYSHPIRLEWIKIIDKMGYKVNRKLTSYFNCGFCGVSNGNKKFLYDWKEVIDVAISNYNQNPQVFATFDRTSAFWSIDQDSFNIALMLTRVQVSEMGPEAMDFTYGGWTMSHAVGSPKPWKKRYFLEFLKGNPPSIADKEYWKYARGIINVYSGTYLKAKQIEVKLASFLGRLYRRY